MTPASIRPARGNHARGDQGHPATTSVQAKRGEAGTAQDRAVLPQEPGKATTPEGGIAMAVSPSASPVVPEWPCLCGARNRLRDLVCRNCGAPKP